MTGFEIITDTTNAALREAAAKYTAALIDIPCYVDDVDGFANAHLGESADNLSTLVLSEGNSLTVKAQDNTHRSRLFVAVDLETPTGGVASIVEPSLSTENGKPELIRPVVRPLTEIEGQELTMDLYSLISKMPADRLKS